MTTKTYDFSTKESWAGELEEMNNIRKKSPWEMAYLMLWGIENFCVTKHDIADLYDEMSEQLEVSRKTLQNYASVARRFQPDQIHERLEIGHHIAVVAMPEDMADYWLSRAEANAWSVQRLRHEIRAAAETPDEDAGDDDEDTGQQHLVVKLLAKHGIDAMIDDDVFAMRFDNGDGITVSTDARFKWGIV